MAVRDLEAFIRQRAALFDPNVDLTPGAPFDVQVIQPLVRRLGTDPFTSDLSTFINNRITQAFPQLAIKEGDAITDLLNKPASLLWDPIVREIRRIRQGQSFLDPSVLTEDEADALGANLFAERKTGDRARGVARLYFSQPQSITVTTANFVTSKTGLHYFPSDIQTIRTEEMLLNLGSDNLYYFNINVIAEDDGTKYNLANNSLVSIANINSAIKVANLSRFDGGASDESAVEFIARARQELTERSLVTLRGIGAKITRSFPQVRRLNVVGFNDPEMQRDVVTGGGLGTIIADGSAGASTADGEGQARTRRFVDASGTPVNFVSLIGSPNQVPTGYILTLFDAFGGTDVVQDLDVKAVLDNITIDLEEQVLVLPASSLRWTLRKSELTLSGIPGGILFPDSQNGTITVEDDEVHIGGTTDIHIRGTNLDEAILTITAITDDEPALSGLLADNPSTTTISLGEFVLGTDYFEGDATFKLLEDAATFGYSTQLITGPSAGVYRVTGVAQISGFAAALTVTPALPGPVAGGPYRWRLVNSITVDLVDPKETRINGADLTTTQNIDIVSTTGGTDFDELGVSKDDVLRILSGPDEGDYAIVEAPLAPNFTTLRIDTPIVTTQFGVSYTIFRPNATGGVDRPLIRVTGVEALDSSGQPQGTTIPYAKPVDIQSRAFQNPARGVKHDLSDARLGIVSAATVGGNFTLQDAAPQLILNMLSDTGPSATITLSITGAQPLATVIADLNTQIQASGFGGTAEVFQIGTDRFGIRPFGLGGKLAIVGGSTWAIFDLFGVTPAQTITSLDIRSDYVDSVGGWAALDPVIDVVTGLDVVQVISGNQIGFYRGPYTLDYVYTGSGLDPSTALVVGSGALLSTPYVPFTHYSAFGAEEDVHIQIGSRSIGSVRCFFMDPTSIEFDQESLFTLDGDNGVLNFFPDPTLAYQLLPPLPSDTTIQDGSAIKNNATDTTFTSLSQDFLLSGVVAGQDELVIETFPLAGDTVLTNPVVGLVNQTLVYTLDNGTARTLTFVQDDASLNPGEVTRDGVIDQINASAGLEICSLTGLNTVEFETTFTLVIETSGSANPTILGSIAGTTAPPILSFFTSSASVTGSVDINSATAPALYGGGGALDTTQLSVDVDGGGALMCTFAAPADQDDVVTQINLSALGAALTASLDEGFTGVGPPSFLVLTSNTTGTTSSLDVQAATAEALLGIAVVLVTGVDQANPTQRSNRSPHFGRYEILDVSSATTLVVPALDASVADYSQYSTPVARQTYKIERVGVQRICTTDMADNDAEASLYYFDVELVSEGTGDLWNIDSVQQMTVTDYRSDGYYLTTDDPNLTFSETEDIKMILSRSILEEGVDDSPVNATQLSGQNAQVSYDRSELVLDVQNFIGADVERVVCSSPLARHLIPYFVRFDMNYIGGSSEDVVVPEIETYIRDLFPIDNMEVSDLEAIVTNRGATSITNPIDLIALVHFTDRTIYIERSQDALGVSRLASFIPDILDVTRSLA